MTNPDTGKCPTCDGGGVDWGERRSCPDCLGTGFAQTDEKPEEQDTTLPQKLRAVLDHHYARYGRPPTSKPSEPQQKGGAMPDPIYIALDRRQVEYLAGCRPRDFDGPGSLGHDIVHACRAALNTESVVLSGEVTPAGNFIREVSWDRGFEGGLGPGPVDTPMTIPQALWGGPVTIIIQREGA